MIGKGVGLSTKTAPHNVQAEEAVLGALLIDATLLERIDLHAADFYLKKHAWIFEVIRDLARRGTAVDYITVTDELDHRQQLDRVGGAAFVARLGIDVRNPYNIHEYAQIVRSCAVKRSVVRLAEEMATTAYNSNGDLPTKLLTIHTQIADLLPESQEEDANDEEVPALDLVLDEGLAGEAGAWVDEYIAYAMNVSPMTPRAFHESAALWLVSSAVARRVVLNMSFDKIYPNLWIAWVAPSTLFGKSTSMNIAQRMAQQVYGHLLTPEDMTPEGLLLDMAGIEPQNLVQLRLEDQQSWQERRNFSAQRAWTMDEFSGLLASSGRDYNAGLIETLMRFYDCTEEYKRLTAGRGMQVIKHSYLTLLAASTPTALASHLTDERLWGMGWWPRFCVLTPESARPAWAEPREQDPPTEIVSRLQQIYERLPVPKWPEPLSNIPAILAFGVFDLWNAYNRALRYDLLTDDLDHRLWAAYGRLPVTALKVATLLAILDWPVGQSMPQIERCHMMRALLTTERWRVSVHRVLSLALNEADDKLTQRIVHRLAANAGGMTLRDLYKSMKGTKPKTIERILADLVLRGEVREIDYQNPRGGPRTTKFAIG